MAGKLGSFSKSDVLSGTENYEMWVPKAQSFLIIEGLGATIQLGNN